MGIGRLILATSLALLPTFLKVPIYRRLFGYKIGRGVKIGLSPFVSVGLCTIGDGVRIGSFNLFYKVNELVIGRHSRFGFLNLMRGGRLVCFGDYCTVLRQNTINAIIAGDFIEPVDASFSLGVGGVIASGHWFDFSSGIHLGDNVIVGGRNSSIWTHNRQRGRPVSVGHHTYLGSEIRVAPGTDLASFCVVALGSVLSGRYPLSRTLVGGNPAVALRPLGDRDLYLVTHRTRSDLPDELATAQLPDDLRAHQLPPLDGRPESAVGTPPDGQVTAQWDTDPMPRAGPGSPLAAGR